MTFVDEQHPGHSCDFDEVLAVVDFEGIVDVFADESFVGGCGGGGMDFLGGGAESAEMNEPA